ncbi:MAG: DUF4392 domain-containing protein [Thiolinea sp.]
MIYRSRGTILIGTGFPVVGTFETDGPVGAIALYHTLDDLGAKPILVCGTPLSRALGSDFRLHEITVGDISQGRPEALAALQHYQPDLVISIERPGLSAQDRYFNMRGEDISARCACFDYFLREASCPTLAIGDGGNEIGMGNLQQALQALDIVPSVTTCDELLVADVSNWGAYGLIALLGLWHGDDLLARINTLEILQYTSQRGSVDGVTRLNTLTEDSLDAGDGQQLIDDLRRLTGFLP